MSSRQQQTYVGLSVIMFRERPILASSRVYSKAAMGTSGEVGDAEIVAELVFGS